MSKSNKFPCVQHVGKFQRDTLHRADKMIMRKICRTLDTVLSAPRTYTYILIKNGRFHLFSYVQREIVRNGRVSKTGVE